jgi:fibronectin type 3 domain-containing protein/TolB-like protein
MTLSKKIAAFVLIACLAGGGTTLYAATYPSNLAVFSLRPTNFEAMGYNNDIMYALLSSLEQNKSIEVLPRRKMEELLFQSGLAQSDNLAHVQKAASAIKVSFVLFGNVTKSGSTISATLHLLDVQHQKVVHSWSPTFADGEAIKRETEALASELVSVITNKGAIPSSASTAGATSPSGIKNLAVQAQPKQVVVSWQPDASLAAAAFNVYRASTAGGPYQFQGRTTRTVFDDQQVRAGRQYHYRIGVVDANGREIMSPVTAEVKFTGEKTPHPPLVMSATGHIRRAVLEFVPSLQNSQDKFKITAYEVYRRADGESAWQPVKSVTADKKSKLSLVVEDLQIPTDGITFTYAIKSIDHKDRESALSDPVTVQIPTPPELQVEKDNLLRRVDFTWQPLAYAKGYYLYRKTATTDWIRVGEIQGAQRARYSDDHDLADGARYEYYLTAFDQAAQTGQSNIVEAQTKAVPPPPSDVHAESGRVKAVKVAWHPIDDPDVGGYIVYRGADPDNLKPIAAVKGYQTDTFLDKGKFLPSFGALLTKGQLFSALEDGKTYYYAVSGLNLFEAEGNLSKTVSAQTKPRPDPADTLTVTGEQGLIRLQWTKSSTPDVASYTIFRSKNSNGWSKLETVNAAQNDYRDTDLKPEMEYRYRVIAEDQDGLKSDPVDSSRIISPVPKPEK